jgi:hypothetical protein
MSTYFIYASETGKASLFKWNSCVSLNSEAGFSSLVRAGLEVILVAAPYSIHYKRLIQILIRKSLVETIPGNIEEESNNKVKNWIIQRMQSQLNTTADISVILDCFQSLRSYCGSIKYDNDGFVFNNNESNVFTW